jgi:uncharacterized RDD family membrane protein YckC
MTHQFKPNLRKRIIASLIDYSIFTLLSYIYIGFFGVENEEGTMVVKNTMAMPILLFWIAYFIGVEGLAGATLGHSAVNLKVVTIQGKKIGISEAFFRHLLDPVDIFIYGIPAIIAIKFTDKNQRLGDLVAKTIVVDMEDSSQI